MFAKIRLEPKMAAKIMFANYGMYEYVNVKNKDYNELYGPEFV